MSLTAVWCEGMANMVFRDSELASQPAQGVSLWEFCPILAILCDPAVGHVFHDDFHVGSIEDGHKFSETGDKADWLVTVIDGAPDEAEVVNVADDGANGILTLTTNNASGDGLALQLNGEAFKLVVGAALWFEANIAIADIDECKFFVGLAIADTDVIGGATETIGFRNTATDGVIHYVTEKDSTETTATTGESLADGVFTKLGFYFDGIATVKFYVNGVLKATVTTNICDDEAMSPCIEIQTAAAAVATMLVDYIRVVQLRQ